jgi:hypothetical protein
MDGAPIVLMIRAVGFVGGPPAVDIFEWDRHDRSWMDQSSSQALVFLAAVLRTSGLLRTFNG